MCSLRCVMTIGALMDRFGHALGTLEAIVGRPYLSVHDNERYEKDWRGRYSGQTLAVARPGCTADVAAVIKQCREAGIAIIPQGGNTGMSGGAVPPADHPNIVLCLDRMNSLRDLDPVGNTVTVDAGCTLAALQEVAAAANRLFPLSLGSEGSCQIGGNIATNAGGTAVLRFGNMRDLVLGLEVVLPDGTVWNGLRGLRKDNTGYDLKQLFIGAEGTLGVITAATLKLYPARPATATAWLGLSGLDEALALLALLQERHNDRLTTFEVMSQGQLDLVLQKIPQTRSPLADRHAWHALVELTDSDRLEELEKALGGSLERALNEDGIQDGIIARSSREAREFWRLRDSVSEANRSSGYSVSHDTSVPLARVPAFVHEASARLKARPSHPQVVAVGHIGDGNIHLVAIFNRDSIAPEALEAEVAAASAEVHRIAADMDGSISAEHGVGSAKREDLTWYKSQVEMGMMRTLKRAFDPKNLMNPGKILWPAA